MTLRRDLLLREAPLLVGLVVAAALLVGVLGAPVEGPEGSDAGQYLYSAEYIWTRSPESRYYDWRKPLYPYLLGLVGNGVGYVLAGAWLARASIALTVLAAGLSGRLLAGAWAGGAAAVLVAWVPLVGPSASWTNLYPLLGAACGLAVAAAAWTARAPGPLPAAVTVALAGAAVLVDSRGAAVALPCVVAAGLCVLTDGAWRRRLAGLGAALLVGGGVVALDQHLYRALGVPRLGLVQAVELQRAITRAARTGESGGPVGPADPSQASPPTPDGPTVGGAPHAARLVPGAPVVSSAPPGPQVPGAPPDRVGRAPAPGETPPPPQGPANPDAPGVASLAAVPTGSAAEAAALDPACADEEAIGPGVLWSPCAAATRAEGLGARVAAGDLPPPAAALLLPLLLVVGRGAPHGRRAAATALLVIGGSAAAIWAAAGLAPLPDRYLTPFLVPLALALPLAADGLLRALAGLHSPRAVTAAPAMGALLAVGVAAATWPGARTPAPAPLADGDRAARVVVAWIRANVGPGELLYDCTGLDLALALLPDRPRAGRCPSELVHRPDEVPEPPSDTPAWLVARVRSEDGGADPAPVLRARGWEPAAGAPVDAGGFSLWTTPP